MNFIKVRAALPTTEIPKPLLATFEIKFYNTEKSFFKNELGSPVL